MRRRCSWNRVKLHVPIKTGFRPKGLSVICRPIKSNVAHLRTVYLVTVLSDRFHCRRVGTIQAMILLICLRYRHHNAAILGCHIRRIPCTSACCMTHCYSFLCIPCNGTRRSWDMKCCGHRSRTSHKTGIGCCCWLQPACHNTCHHIPRSLPCQCYQEILSKPYPKKWGGCPRGLQHEVQFAVGGHKALRLYAEPHCAAIKQL